MTLATSNTSKTFTLGFAAASLIAASSFAGPVFAQAAAAPADTGQQADTAASAAQPTAKPSDGALTWHGITLYGTIDIGLAYLSHGAPLTSYYGPGLPFVLQKNSNRAITSISPNGLSQSKIGISGAEAINDDAKVVFKLETGFQPTSGHLSNGPKSLIINNGRPAVDQITSGDSSRAGQLFQGAAYLGVASKTWGTLTYGLQNSLLLDNFAKYDPQGGSQAFSVIGYSGFASGGGATETARFDSSVKYTLAKGPMRFAAMHNFQGADNFPGEANEVDVGGDYQGFSADLTYTHVADAVSESSLSAAQDLVHPGTLAASVSDNTAYAVEAKYVYQKAKFYAGFENIEFANPKHPLPASFQGIGAYDVDFVNNNAYAHHRIEKVSWVGMRYSLTAKLDVTGAYYRYDQNSYKGNGCSDTSASSCSGTLQDYSLVADYRLTKRFDVYGGIDHSQVADGLASGYLQTSMIAPVAGVRFTF
ncbi:MAG TPA: porin [Phenylobacterium sp.]|nr:porin [Phenylobacterium sp.]